MLPPQSPSVATFDSVVIAVVIVLVVVVVVVVVIVALVDIAVVILVGIVVVVVVVVTSGFNFFLPSDPILSSQPTMLLRSIFN